MFLSIVFGLVSLPSAAQKVITIGDSSYHGTIWFLKKSNNPLCVRLHALSDRRIEKAIAECSRRRQVRILSDVMTPDLHRLLRYRRIDIRLAGSVLKADLRSGPNPKSEAISHKGDDYEIFAGPATWARSNFAGAFTYVECGAVRKGERPDLILKKFGDEFARGRKTRA